MLRSADMRPYYGADGIQIFHADCRDVMHSAAVSDVDVVVTDPPYGIGGSPKRGGGKQGTLDYTLGTGGVEFPWDIRDDTWLRWWAGPIAAFCAVSQMFSFAKNLRADGMLLYVKSNPHPNGSSFEPCPTRGFGVGARHVEAYNSFAGQLHPTQKPLDVMLFVVGRAPDGIVLDPFMGSGTTLVAAKNLGRNAIGIEIEERYCEIAAQRLCQGVLELSA